MKSPHSSLEVAPSTLATLSPTMVTVTMVTVRLAKFWQAVIYLRFPIQVCFSSTLGHASSCRACLPLVTLNCHQLDQHVKYLGQRSLSSTNTHTHTHTHTHIRLIVYLDH